MAKWEEAFNELGDDGKKLVTELKDAFSEIRDDFSSFLQSEADRLKTFLKLRAEQKIDDEELGLLFKSERRLITAHAAKLAATGVAKAEKTAAALLVKVLARAVKLLV